jgi:hypothetical protein
MQCGTPRRSARKEPRRADVREPVSCQSYVWVTVVLVGVTWASAINFFTMGCTSVEVVSSAISEYSVSRGGSSDILRVKKSFYLRYVSQ